MFAVIKEKETTWVAVSNADCLTDMNRADMLLEDNISAWKIPGHKGWYAVCGRQFVEVDILRYTKGLFDKEITYQSLMQYTIPKIKRLLESRSLVKEKCWYNDLLIVSKDKAYFIDGYFCLSEVQDFAASDTRADIVRGALEYTKGLPALERLREAVRSIEEARGRSRFPALVLNVATGKKAFWYTYEDAVEKTAQRKRAK